MPEIILASASPRRKQLLEWADINFTILVAGTEEDFPAGLSFTEIPIHIAANKAYAVQQKIGEDTESIIIAADTIGTFKVMFLENLVAMETYFSICSFDVRK